MNEIELKSIIHECVENIYDLDFLEEVKRLLEEKYPALKQAQVPSYIMNILDESEKEIERGDFIINEELERDTDKWLNE